MSGNGALTPGLRGRLAKIEERYDELGRLMADPATTADPARIRSVGKELADLGPVVETVRALRQAERKQREAKELTDGGDADLRDPGNEVFRPYPSSVWPVSKTVRAADVSGCSRHYGGGTGSRPWPAAGHSDGSILYRE